MSAKLRTIEPEPLGEGIVKALEGALELARDGKLSSVAIALVYRDGCAGNVSSFMPSRAAMVGSLAMLQDKIINGAAQ
jgi:hypothetical protein